MSSSSSPIDRPKKKSRVGHVQAACINCRSRRRKCDGVRPACVSCVQRQVPCTYDTQRNETRRAALRREHQSSERSLVHLQGIVDTLLYAPEHDALSLLARLRAQTNIDVSTAVTPALQERIEVGSLRPLQDPSADKTFASLDDILATTFPNAYPVLVGDVAPELFIPNPLSHSSSPKPSTGQYVDLRLLNLDISFWTTTISSSLAAELINLYLDIEHPVSGHFDADLFLNDLVSHETDHCSSLLVLAVLCWSSRMKAAFDAAIAAAEPVLLDQLRAIWDVERYHDSALSVAAMSIWESLSATTGRDMQTRLLKWEGGAMAERLNLFNNTPHPALRYDAAGHVLTDSSQSHIAWSIYYTSLVLACVYVGDVFPGRPPNVPFPIQTPTNHLRDTFPALCRLTAILHDIVAVYQLGYGPIAQRVPLDFVQTKYGELLAWAAELNHQQLRSHNAPHNVDHLHLQYHTILMMLFRPFKHVRLSLNQVHATPAQLEYASLRQLKSLIIRYRQRYSNTLYCVHWMPFLVQTFMAVLRDPSDEVWNFYSRLVIDCYKDVAIWSDTMNLTILCLMGMAVTRGRVSQTAMAELIQGFQMPSSAPTPQHVLEGSVQTGETNEPKEDGGALLVNYVQNLSLSHFEDRSS